MSETLETLMDRLRSWMPTRRVAAAEALGRLGDARAIPGLDRAVSDWDPWVRAAAAEALGQIGDPEVVDPLLTALADRNRRVRAAAAEALGRVGAARGVLPLIRALADPDPEVRQAAAQALGGTRHVRAVVTRVREMAGAGNAQRQTAGETRVPLSAGGRPPLLDEWSEWDARMGRAANDALKRAALELEVRISGRGWRPGDAALWADLDAPRSVPMLLEALRRVPTSREGSTNIRDEARDALIALAPGPAELAAQAIPRFAHANLDIEGRNLKRLLSGETQYHVGDHLEAVLLACGEAAVMPIIALLPDATPAVWSAAHSVLRRLDEQTLARVALAVLCGTDPAARLQLRYFAEWGVEGRWRVVEGWATLRGSPMPHGIRHALRQLLEHADGWVRLWAAEGLGRASGAVPGDRLPVPSAANDPARVVLAGYAGDVNAVDPLRALLERGSLVERAAAARALAVLGAPAAGTLGLLREHLAAEQDEAAREVYARAVERIQLLIRALPTELLSSSAPEGRGTELEAAEGVKSDGVRG